ncbi:MAG: hypothetical protein PHG67_13965 [Bacteroidales bacterium]|jgi:hypothetical protein|nr:hypothetical protein [Bacteroidales bacterium]HOI31264.1 hypothetical protein [Bacteroidales bacterium]
MKKWMKILVLFAVIGIAAASYVYVFVYNKAHPDYRKLEPNFSLSSESCFEAFKKDASEANQRFIGQMLQLSGTLNQIESTEKQTIFYFIHSEGMFGNEGVRVNMLPDEQLSEIISGQDITIKGYCTGYNQTDVILEHGSVIY